ncbi:MAG: hypothetical protein WA744_01350, partial [Candidatus Acidiferrales bacterium]
MIDEHDTAKSWFVAVVNATFAREFFPKQDPLGKTFGILGDASHSAMISRNLVPLRILSLADQVSLRPWHGAESGEIDEHTALWSDVDRRLD